jgi:hypothetical protein
VHSQGQASLAHDGTVVGSAPAQKAKNLTDPKNMQYLAHFQKDHIKQRTVLLRHFRSIQTAQLEHLAGKSL